MTRWRRPPTPTHAANGIHATSPSGRATSRGTRGPRPGRAPGVAGARVGTWSAPPWPASSWATPSTSTAVASTSVPAPRERTCPVDGRGPWFRPVLDAQRVGHHGRREDEQVPGQRGAGRGGDPAGPAAAVRSTSPSRTTARRSSSVDDLTFRGRAALARIDGSLERTTAPVGRAPTGCRRASVAMDDDLGTPGALAVVLRRRPGRQLALRPAIRTRWRPGSARCSAMLAILGLDPPTRCGPDGDAAEDSPPWSTAWSPSCSAAAGGPGPQGLATADAVRDALAAWASSRRHPHGPRWSLVQAHARRTRQCPEQPAQGRGPHRARATRPVPAAGSVAGLEGKGPTPKAEDRPYHAAYRGSGQRPRAPRRSGRAPRTGRTWSGPEWVAGRNRAGGAEAQIPVKAAYRRGRRAGRSAAGHPQTRRRPQHALLEANRAELDRLTGGAVHQGIALQLPPYEYAHPVRPDRRRSGAYDPRSGPRLDHRPPQPRARSSAPPPPSEPLAC